MIFDELQGVRPGWNLWPVIQRSELAPRYQKEITTLTSSGDRRIAASAEGDSVCCSFCKKEPATVGV